MQYHPRMLSKLLFARPAHSSRKETSHQPMPRAIPVTPPVEAPAGPGPAMSYDDYVKACIEREVEATGARAKRLQDETTSGPLLVMTWSPRW